VNKVKQSKSAQNSLFVNKVKQSKVLKVQVRKKKHTTTVIPTKTECPLKASQVAPLQESRTVFCKTSTKEEHRHNEWSLFIMPMDGYKEK
jgi:hypothetical protein